MKNSLRIAIVVALAIAVVVIVVAKSNRSAPGPAATVEQRAGAGPAAGSPKAERVPRLLELGSTSCIPCKMMAPILERLKKKYQGKFQVEFIDVRKNPSAGERYGIKMIPTQIFFDASGKEVSRHVGFFPQEEIEKKLAEMGVK